MNKKDNFADQNAKEDGKDNLNTIKAYISDLASKKPEIREKARTSIIGAGDSAVPALIESLANSNAKIRWEAGKLIEDMEFDWSNHSDKKTVSTFVDYLNSADGFVRLTARNSLIKIGAKAVTELIGALSSKPVIKRWEAVKALSQIADPAALKALVNALDDKEFDIRWVAAEGLIAMGNRSIEPVLGLIMSHPDSISLREGVHHVLYALNTLNQDEIIKPVIEALESTEAPLQVPWAAEKALKLLTMNKE